LSIAPSASKLKPAKLTLRLSAAAGGKKDKDTVKFVCNPAQPSLAHDVQPIFTTNCTYAGCHSGLLPEHSLSLEDGHAATDLAKKALAQPKFFRLKPRSIKKSYLAMGLLGTNGAVLMPDGCPNVVSPVTRCLTPAEVYTILAWIQAGALP